MTAQILESKPIVSRIKEEIKNEVNKLKDIGITPRLVTVLVGGDAPSMTYAQSKEKSCKALGIDFALELYKDNVPEDKIIETIQALNIDPFIHGIMLELPLPKHIDSYNVTSAIYPKKDVDGVTPVNRGLLLMGRLDEALVPVTPLSCLTLIESTNVEIKGKNVAIIGRGPTVGLPLTLLLIKKNTTVTVCHSQTKNLANVVKNADIVVAATGQAGLVKVDMLSPGQIVIDAGISVLPDGKLKGDVEEGAADVVDFLSPVPGGVGSLTVTLLLKNLIKAISLQKGK
ncbi:MAG: bifunctional 5,10-methylenetetrahydrofolate dehydrogenase/5,10-methenyltetrahydrofolate cyclohydrolase [Deltaproteobacteria bacterium]|jgi:methylenetetrahydrofolate dehydrogenase (NADP+)/methenyltetrahydrofolate cyclohydrolase|nr:bifunctional 5,10-methylenetetrahydrofolate dehydrogenase/5,10-methenyltetrahydrofolate cyclohydrolase [Deltaproteobacteria bacterium]